MTPKRDTIPWRVFYTAPRAEKKCEQRLLDAGVDVFVPTCIVRHRWKDRWKNVEEPLFRSYLFGHVDERDRIHVLETPGIVRCVSFGGRVAEMSQDEIDRIRCTQNDREHVRLFAGPLPRVGRTVRVTRGPFHGLTGLVVQHRAETSVVVRIPSIRQALRVILPADDVEVVASPPSEKHVKRFAGRAVYSD